VPNAKDLVEELDNLAVLVVGPAGTGKSVFASSAPTPAYVLDTGKEMLSYRGLDFDYDTFPKEGKSWAKMIRAVNSLAKGIVPFSDKPAHKDPKTGIVTPAVKGVEKVYKTVIIDNLSGATDIAMLRAMEIDRNRDPVGGPLWNVHYKMVANLVEDLIRLLLEIPGNKIATAHTSTTKDDLTGRILAEPRLQGRLSDVAPQWFDEVLYGTPRVGPGGRAEYMLQTVNTGFYKARSRISGKARKLPDYIPNEWDYLTLKKRYDPTGATKNVGATTKPPTKPPAT